MIFSSAALATSIESTATKLGVQLPPEFTAELTAARALPRDIDYSAALDQMNAAAVTAMREGRDPITDPVVQQYATARALHEAGFRAAAERWYGEMVTELIHAHADSITAVFAQAIRPDLDALQAAAGQLAMPDLNACDPITLKKDGKLALWADATSAAERADAALAGLRAILRALNYGHDGETGVLLLAPTADWPTVAGVAARAGRQLTAWAIARGGTALALPTVTEYARAVARLTAERQERERQAETEAQEQRSLGSPRRREWQRVR